MVKRVLLMAIIAMQVVAGWAETEVVNGIEWTYTITDGKASVGGGSFSKTAVLGTTSGEITIPSTLGGCPVTGIANSAFYNCREITSITIPNGVEYIGNDMGVYRSDKASFGNCWSLTSITIPSSVTNITPSSFFMCTTLHDIIVDSNNKSYKTVDGLLLSMDGTQLIASPADKISVEIPNGVTSIEFGAFAYCDSITSVMMPDSVTNIGRHAFFCCASLVNLSLSKNISFIGDKSFESCRSLKNIVIPSGVESIEYKAFFDCASLESVTIPDSVVAIWDGAFGYCTSLTSVTIPDSVTSIYNRAFENCTNLTKISMPLALKEQVEEENIFDGCSENLEIVYREPVEWEYTVTDGKATITDVPETVSGEVIIPSTLGGNPVTSIGEWAFSGCYSLTSVTIPDSVTSIGDFAFCDCALKSVTIPDSVTSIGLAAFSYCESLTSVTIPNTVTNIGDGAFSDCYSLQTIIVEEDNNNYKSIDGLLLSKDGKALVACPGTKTNVKIPDGVTSIRDVAIGGCCFLTSVTIPDSVTNIGNSVFAECISLTSVTIPDSVTSIGIYAFSYCESLTSVAIPDSVTSIGEYAFQDCADLVKVSLPLALKEQVEEGNVFDGCSDDLEIVYREPIEWEYTVTDGKATITGVPTTISGEVIIPSMLGGYPVTSIGDSAFFCCYSLTSVTIPNSVTNIGYSAFCYCSKLESVVIPSSVISIDAFAFACCESLTSAEIPDSVTNIYNSSFIGCRGLTDNDGFLIFKNILFVYCGDKEDVVIPEFITEISDSAFADCVALKSVRLHEGVESIGEEVFVGCLSMEDIFVDPENPYYKSENGLLFSKNGLELIAFANGKKNIVIPDSVKSIGSPYSWSGPFTRSSVTNVIIGSGVESIPDYAFEDCYDLKSITIGNNVKSIGELAFDDCWSLTRISIPNSVTHISGGAFHECSAFESITIPASVVSIGDAAFGLCYELKSIYFEGNAPTGNLMGGGTWFDGQECTAYVKKESTGWGVDIPGTWKRLKIEYYEYSPLSDFSWEVSDGGVTITEYVGSSEVVEIPVMIDNLPVRAISADAFKDKPFVEEVVIPESVTHIDRSAFEGTSFGDKVYTAMFKTAADSLVSGGNSTPLNASLALTVTNVVVHFVTQSIPSDAVIPTTTSGIVNVITEINSGSAIAITEEWAKQYEGFVSKFGDNFTAAITAKTGKCDGAGKPMMVWQDYVAGTDPTNPNDIFKASITFDKDTNEPIISWTPELSEVEAAKRSYKVFGKIKLTDKNWTLISGNASDYNFFKVTVEMR